VFQLDVRTFPIECASWCFDPELEVSGGVMVTQYCACASIYT
jgi:hypothetical protein